jgi:hypothetical protein
MNRESPQDEPLPLTALSKLIVRAELGDAMMRASLDREFKPHNDFSFFHAGAT